MLTSCWHFAKKQASCVPIFKSDERLGRIDAEEGSRVRALPASFHCVLEHCIILVQHRKTRPDILKNC